MSQNSAERRGEAIKRRLFGGGVWATVLQLVIASIFVGAFFSFIGLDALEFWEGVFRGVRDLASHLGETFGEIIVNLVTYLMIGAAIVVPIWLIARILSGRR